MKAQFYLLVRPTCGRESMLLSKREKVCLNAKHLNGIWRGTMPDGLADSRVDLRPVRSHFDRHWFTTYWNVHQDVNSELVPTCGATRPGVGARGVR